MLGLRYSLIPRAIVFPSSIGKYNDLEKKYSNEYGILCLKEDQMVFVRIKVLASLILLIRRHS